MDDYKNLLRSDMIMTIKGCIKADLDDRLQVSVWPDVHLASVQ